MFAVGQTQDHYAPVQRSRPISPETGQVPPGTDMDGFPTYSVAIGLASALAASLVLIFP